MSVCIVGAGGFIGRNLTRAFPDAVALTRRDLDLLNEKDTGEYFSSKHFGTIIHCACKGGRRTKQDGDSVFTDNIDMFENVYKNARFDRLIWFSSGAANLQTPYGRAKKYIETRVVTDSRVNVFKLWGCFGPGEASHRFFTSGILNRKIVIERDRYFDFVHVDDLIHVINTTRSEKMVHVVYQSKYKLSELAEIAGIPFTILDESVIDPPYIGEQTVPLILPSLSDRIAAFCRTSSFSGPGTCQVPLD